MLLKASKYIVEGQGVFDYNLVKKVLNFFIKIFELCQVETCYMFTLLQATKIIYVIKS